jgi:hypothetical protein
MAKPQPLPLLHLKLQRRSLRLLIVMDSVPTGKHKISHGEQNQRLTKNVKPNLHSVEPLFPILRRMG